MDKDSDTSNADTVQTTPSKHRNKQRRQGSTPNRLPLPPDRGGRGRGGRGGRGILSGRAQYHSPPATGYTSGSSQDENSSEWNVVGRGGRTLRPTANQSTDVEPTTLFGSENDRSNYVPNTA